MFMIIMIILAGTLILLEIFSSENSQIDLGDLIGKRILQEVLFFVLGLGALVMSDESNPMYVNENIFPVLVICCIVYGFWKNQKIYKVTGFIYASLIVMADVALLPYWIWKIVIFAIIVALHWRYKEHYKMWTKLVTYLLFCGFLLQWQAWIVDAFYVKSFYIQNEELVNLLFLMLHAGVNLSMMKIPVLSRNLRTGEEEKVFGIVTGIIHILQMIIAVNYINSMDSFGYHLWAIMVGAVLFAANVKTVLQRFNCKWSSIYVGTKIFVFICVILGSFNAPDYWFSIVALLFAIAFIVIGFFVELRLEKPFKTLRIYGLIISLISIVKLLVLDIYYDNVISLAVSFFISGLLCFAISFIYNWVDKKIAIASKEKEE